VQEKQPRDFFKKTTNARRTELKKKKQLCEKNKAQVSSYNFSI
jgi:hypothetical protein